ncbi:hypothetical protein, partial [Streptomyces anulatus]|uniref:hypothetical protein n=1 Tax=Streptomyces anulatus TaxID=1892 RepID=UPI00344AC729
DLGVLVVRCQIDGLGISTWTPFTRRYRSTGIVLTRLARSRRHAHTAEWRSAVSPVTDTVPARDTGRGGMT